MHDSTSIVLIVEDDAIILMDAAEIAASAGHVPLEAGNADDAIRILARRPDIDLVFTDVQMPGTMDGIDLARYIRKTWPPVRLLVASGCAILPERCLPHGSTFLMKPYSAPQIVDAMAHLLSPGT